MKWCQRKCYCSNKEKNNTLAELETGSIVNVIDLCKDRNFRNRIVSLGIQVGSKIEVIKKTYSQQGCMIIRVNDCRLVINSELANKIKISKS